MKKRRVGRIFVDVASQQDFEHDEDSGVKKVIRRIFSNMLKFLNSLVCGVLKR